MGRDSMPMWQRTIRSRGCRRSLQPRALAPPSPSLSSQRSGQSAAPDSHKTTRGTEPRFSSATSPTSPSSSSITETRTSFPPRGCGRWTRRSQSRSSRHRPSSAAWPTLLWRSPLLAPMARRRPSRWAPPRGASRWLRVWRTGRLGCCMSHSSTRRSPASTSAWCPKAVLAWPSTLSPSVPSRSSPACAPSSKRQSRLTWACGATEMWRRMTPMSLGTGRRRRRRRPREVTRGKSERGRG
mmetsp:Transcript_17163/g.56054  ORF Transcript_17163/g.56054 Transcript_17163/m.56054 type:complete len:240 (+) Transcript_17163:91-810(+)